MLFTTLRSRARSMRRLRLPTLLTISVSLLTASCSSGPGPVSAPGASSSYRVYETATRRFVGIDAVARRLGDLDVAFFGEFHDNAGSHEAQRDLLALVASQNRPVVLGFEMFERDVQPIIDEYLRGTIDEDAFLRSARPWPNYGTDYRPLLELARAHRWPVLATNLPRRLAASIGRQGLAAREHFGAGEDGFIAATVECPLDDYWVRFVETLTGEEDADGSTAHTTVDPKLQNFFQAQCARDSTMAEALAPHVDEGTLVLHLNGGFHTDFRLGIVDRLLLRRPEARIGVITTVQVEDMRGAELEEDLERADFLIVTEAGD
jgi:uncharacterized iron-regulated protein